MKKYLPDANPADSGNTYAYAVSPTMRALPQGLRRQPDAREPDEAGRQHEATSVVPMLLPGIKINTSPTDFYPIQSVRLSAFDGETWKLFGDVLSNESA